MHQSLTRRLVFMSCNHMFSLGVFTIVCHTIWFGLWLISSVSYAESITGSLTALKGQELPQCTALHKVLSSPQFTRKQLSDHLAPISPSRWRYRKARKLLFSRVAPVMKEGKMVVEALYTGRRARPRRMKSPIGFNCEHVWPRAWMNSKRSRIYRSQEADLHNLYPSEVRVNSRRGHLPFGQVIESKYPAASPSKIGIHAHGDQVVEVRDEYKGDVARTLLYMAARWNLDFPITQELGLLAHWAKYDPPSDVEHERNRRIHLIQRNHNPLIHCPQVTHLLIQRLETHTRKTNRSSARFSR